MKKTRSFSATLSCILCMVLIAAMALFATGCNDNSTPETPQTSGAPSSQAASTPDASTPAESTPEVTEKGEGATQFTFIVCDLDGKETTFRIHTDETKVGAALQAVGLIEGEMGDYGLYVKAVNGKTLDFTADGAYWSFYINGEYASTGVDMTDIAAGQTYMFKAEKA
ncbi:MAG: DUF4430 domain-containing protein [Ruminococcaceae bacterium]|nr:DUF4430 domain-containing protein [Oscillospiraceae bacterium]